MEERYFGVRIDREKGRKREGGVVILGETGYIVTLKVLKLLTGNPLLVKVYLLPLGSVCNISK